MAKKKNDGCLSLAAWVRNQLIRNPQIELEALVEQAKVDGRSEKVDDKQVMYLAKSAIRKRWGVNPEELPRAKDGSLNMSGMVRIYIDMYGDDVTEKKAKSYFETDGLELGPGQFANAKATYLRKKGNLDPNSGKGPRARYTTKKGRKPGRKAKSGLKTQAQLNVTVDLLMQTKEYIQSVGGVDQARTLMNFIEEIQALPNN